MYGGQYAKNLPLVMYQTTFRTCEWLDYTLAI